MNLKKFITVLFLLFVFKSYGLNVNHSGEIILGGEVSSAGDVIQINASDVTLNLKGNTVTDGTRGIVINQGLSNIIIKNGTIKNNCIGISINQNCTNINIKNVNISNCSDRAIEIVGSPLKMITTLLMSNIIMESCATSTSADNVLHINYAQDIAINNIFINQCGVNTRGIEAFNVKNTTKALIENVSIIGNVGLTFQGFHIEDSNNILLNSNNVRVNTATNNLFAFLFIGNNTSNICRNCIVTDNTSINGPLAGWEVQSNIDRVILEQCMASNNLTTGAVSTANCIGFNFDQCLNCSIFRCKSLNNRAMGNGLKNFAAGFNISSSAGGITGVKNSEFIDNVAHRNNGFSDIQSYGFRVISNAGGNENNLFQSNIASRNGPVAPLEGNQIVPDAGKGSNKGGVPNGSITNFSYKKLNKKVEVLSNVTII